jgi:hypothetical protein
MFGLRPLPSLNVFYSVKNRVVVNSLFGKRKEAGTIKPNTDSLRRYF